MLLISNLYARKVSFQFKKKKSTLLFTRVDYSFKKIRVNYYEFVSS